MQKIHMKQKIYAIDRQSYFVVPKSIRQYSPHYFIIKVANKRELQQIPIYHLPDIDFKDIMNLNKKCTVYFFYTNTLYSMLYVLFNGPEVLSSASDKAKLFAKNFSKNSNLDDLGISLPVFSSRTNLKLYNISVTPKTVKQVITNLDSSKVFGPDCIPVVILKNCEPELS